MDSLLGKIGFMQGRLSPVMDGLIQAFPWDHWRDEFVTASAYGFPFLEWTIDQENLRMNPFTTPSGQEEIKELSQKYGLRVHALTGDCFMQAPFYKASGALQTALLKDLELVIMSSVHLGLELVLIPLVDDGRIENRTQEKNLRLGLTRVEKLLADSGLRIVFESDYPPDRLAGFISDYDPKFYGLCYDIGNSAALGYRPMDEMAAYGSRVLHVHVKDRRYKGKSVPLGEGDADLAGAFQAILSTDYNGVFVLQTARAEDNDHVGALLRYRRMTAQWLEGSVRGPKV